MCELSLSTQPRSPLHVLSPLLLQWFIASHFVPGPSFYGREKRRLSVWEDGMYTPSSALCCINIHLWTQICFSWTVCALFLIAPAPGQVNEDKNLTLGKRSKQPSQLVLLGLRLRHGSEMLRKTWWSLCVLICIRNGCEILWCDCIQVDFMSICWAWVLCLVWIYSIEYWLSLFFRGYIKWNACNVKFNFE